MIGSNYRQFAGFTGCYIQDELQNQYVDKIFLLYDRNLPNYEEKEIFLKKHFLYLDDYAYGDYQMFVFNLPEGYENNYHLFKRGEYSKFDDTYKRHVSSFFNNFIYPYYLDGDKTNRDDNNILSLSVYIRQVLYKSERLFTMMEDRIGQEIDRSSELASQPSYEKDVFSEKTLKKLNKSFEDSIEEWI